eukprot:TRINITY_DN16400_c0_g1_i1.p1 TRINITY_DN16400_c0_g1~~TRINITY_DN16400_c0_g1_i1.p1  ORF type:complete len:885 (+),score=206.58 TRINITY_DN16400_c0_g1_i1:130-2784(+)
MRDLPPMAPRGAQRGGPFPLDHHGGLSQQSDLRHAGCGAAYGVTSGSGCADSVVDLDNLQARADRAGRHSARSLCSTSCSMSMSAALPSTGPGSVAERYSTGRDSRQVGLVRKSTSELHCQGHVSADEMMFSELSDERCVHFLRRALDAEAYGNQLQAELDRTRANLEESRKRHRDSNQLLRRLGDANAALRKDLEDERLWRISALEEDDETRSARWSQRGDAAPAPSSCRVCRQGRGGGESERELEALRQDLASMRRQLEDAKLLLAESQADARKWHERCADAEKAANDFATGFAASRTLADLQAETSMCERFRSELQAATENAQRDAAELLRQAAQCAEKASQAEQAVAAERSSAASQAAAGAAALTAALERAEAAETQLETGSADKVEKATSSRAAALEELRIARADADGQRSEVGSLQSALSSLQKQLCMAQLEVQFQQRAEQQASSKADAVARHEVAELRAALDAARASQFLCAQEASQALNAERQATHSALAEGAERSARDGVEVKTLCDALAQQKSALSIAQVEAEAMRGVTEQAEMAARQWRASCHGCEEELRVLVQELADVRLLNRGLRNRLADVPEASQSSNATTLSTSLDVAEMQRLRSEETAVLSKLNEVECALQWERRRSGSLTSELSEFQAQKQRLPAASMQLSAVSTGTSLPDVGLLPLRSQPQLATSGGRASTGSMSGCSPQSFATYMLEDGSQPAARTARCSIATRTADSRLSLEGSLSLLESDLVSPSLPSSGSAARAFPFAGTPEKEASIFGAALQHSLTLSCSPSPLRGASASLLPELQDCSPASESRQRSARGVSWSPPTSPTDAASSRASQDFSARSRHEQVPSMAARERSHDRSRQAAQHLVEATAGVRRMVMPALEAGSP